MENPPTILVIEDSPVVQHVLRATLAPLGGGLLVAGDGELGLELARARVPDVIVLDIGLPGINGWEVLTELRAHPATNGIGVVVLTAHVQQSMKQLATELGADSFIGKPFQPDALRSLVSRLLVAQPAFPAAAGA